MNVNRSVEIGIHQLMEILQSLPESFREQVSAKVVLMAEGKKAKKVAAKNSFNTELILSRVLYLLRTE